MIMLMVSVMIKKPPEVRLSRGFISEISDVLFSIEIS
jgi:hypothetical protein